MEERLAEVEAQLERAGLHLGVRQISDRHMLIVDADNSLWLSPGMARRLGSDAA